MKQTYLNYYKEYFKRPEPRAKLTRAGIAWKRRKVELLGIGYETARKYIRDGTTVSMPRGNGERPRRHEIHTCRRCRRYFWRPVSYRNQQFCSVKCYKNARNDEGNMEVKCKQCGKVKTINKSRFHAKRGGFCSKACYLAYPHEAKFDQTCEECGIRFKSKYPKCRWCSDGCRSAGYLDRHHQKKIELLEISRTEDGRRFLMSYGKAKRLFEKGGTVTVRQYGGSRKQAIGECKECDRWFFRRDRAYKGHPLPVFCSAACRHQNLTEERWCQTCGKSLGRISKSDLALGRGKFCSPVCRWVGPKPSFDKICEWCGKEFVSNHPGTKCCSRSCKDKNLRLPKSNNVETILNRPVIRSRLERKIGEAGHTLRTGE